MTRRYRVVFAKEARSDLLSIGRFVTKNGSRARAVAFTTSIVAYCEEFDMFPQRGTSREDLGHGLRVVGWRGRVSIAFLVGDRDVTVLRILYGGRDLKKELG